IREIADHNIEQLHARKNLHAENWLHAERQIAELYGRLERLTAELRNERQRRERIVASLTRGQWPASADLLGTDAARLVPVWEPAKYAAQLGLTHIGVSNLQ